MMPIDEKFIRDKDAKLIEENVKLHARPFHVVTAWMTERRIAGDLLDTRIWAPLMDFYRSLYPNENFSMPPLLVGGVALRDRMYFVRVNVCYGRVAINPMDCIAIRQEELAFIFTHFPEQGWRAFYGVCDLWDFAYGVEDLIALGSTAVDLLNNARSSLVATPRILTGDIDIDSAVQTACLTAELSMKAVLVQLGATEAQLKKLSHRLPDLANALIIAKSVSTDDRLRSACSKFPDYVATRYSSHGLTRFQLMELAMRAQFVAADAIRRISQRNLCGDLEANAGIPARPAL